MLYINSAVVVTTLSPEAAAASLQARAEYITLALPIWRDITTHEFCHPTVADFAPRRIGLSI
ncbi:hypothetical protein [Anabaena sp. PCC 7108]|uniref:hypothetical protein n=1 Tax=Anabaena sp. PCC 7108 TaxID=163908 RepID=UPI00034C4267|nr:hypothetical protein [Anabaena sp. PCC 7108]